MALSKKAKLTFNTIIEAASEHRLCLVECDDRKTGKKVYVYFTNDDGAVTSNRIIIAAN